MSSLLHGIFWYFPCLYPLLYVRHYIRQSIIPLSTTLCGITSGSPSSLTFNTSQGRHFIRQTASLLSQIVLPNGRYVALAAMPLSLGPVSMRCSSVSGRFLPHLEQVEEVLTFGWRQASRLPCVKCKYSEQIDTYRRPLSDTGPFVYITVFSSFRPPVTP
jgi:hypothetical protein